MSTFEEMSESPYNITSESNIESSYRYQQEENNNNHVESSNNDENQSFIKNEQKVYEDDQFRREIARTRSLSAASWLHSERHKVIILSLTILYL